MIGRASLGRPWLPGVIAQSIAGIDVDQPSLPERFLQMRRHLTALHDFHGDFMGIRIARKHVGWYSKGQRGASEFRRNFQVMTEAHCQYEAAEEFFDALMEGV